MYIEFCKLLLDQIVACAPKKWCSSAIINREYRFKMTAIYLNCSETTDRENWQIINDTRNSEKSTGRISCQRNIFGDLVTEHSKIANLLNYRFLELIDYLGKHCDLSYVSIPKTTQSFSFRFITTRETFKILNFVIVRKSTGPSDISPWALKVCSAEIAEHLTFLFNAFIAESNFPSQFKEATVTPIIKKGDSEDPQNYRPIILTSVLSRLFEKILANQIKEYLNRFDLISLSVRLQIKSQQQMLWSIAQNFSGVKSINTNTSTWLCSISRKHSTLSNTIFWRRNYLI